jgi:hypothetical protein
MGLGLKMLEMEIPLAYFAATPLMNLKKSFTTMTSVGTSMKLFSLVINSAVF